MRALLVALLVLAAPLAGCAERDPAEPAAEPAWSFQDLDGAVHTSEDFEGAPAMLFFMATWCVACRARAPILREVYDDYAPRGLRAASVSFDPGDREDGLRAWKERYGHEWPHGVDPGLRMQRHFAVTSQSTVVVLDAEGAVVRKFGYPGPDEATLRDALETAFDQ